MFFSAYHVLIEFISIESIDGFVVKLTRFNGITHMNVQLFCVMCVNVCVLNKVFCSALPAYFCNTFHLTIGSVSCFYGNSMYFKCLVDHSI